jgi:hypothetical protein
VVRSKHRTVEFGRAPLRTAGREEKGGRAYLVVSARRTSPCRCSPPGKEAERGCTDGRKATTDMDTIDLDRAGLAQRPKLAEHLRLTK